MPNGAPFELALDHTDYAFNQSRAAIVLSDDYDEFTLQFITSGGNNIMFILLYGEFGAAGVDDGLVPIPSELNPLPVPNPGFVSINLPAGVLDQSNYTFNRLSLTAVPLPPALAFLTGGLTGLMAFSRRRRA